MGRAHPLRDEARAFLLRARREEALATSAEVLQELLHIYLPAGRVMALDAALRLADSVIQEIWPVEAEDVRFARTLLDRFPGFSARDLLHLACCKRRDVTTIKTFDRVLAAAFRRR